MAQAGFTPIRLYYSTTALTAPAAGNLAAGELAINITDEKLYFKNNSGVVKVLADSGSATGNLPGGSTGSVVYQASTGVTAYLTLGSQGSLLFAGASAPQYLPLGTSSWILTAGATTPTYVNPSSISVGFATNAGKATDISGGATNQILYQTATGFTGFVVAPTTSGYVLGWNGSAFNWVAAPAATSAINLSGGTAGEVVFQTAPGTTGYTTGGVNGYLLTSSGTSAPTWSNPASLTVGHANTATTATAATNIVGGVAGEIPYQTGVNTTGFTAVGSAGYLLSANGSSAPTWLDPSTITVGNATNATNATNASNATNAVNATTSTNLAGGTASQIPYQTGSGVTAFIPNGNAGQILTSNGTSAPSWQDQVPAVTKGFVYFCAQF